MKRITLALFLFVVSGSFSQMNCMLRRTSMACLGTGAAILRASTQQQYAGLSKTDHRTGHREVITPRFLVPQQNFSGGPFFRVQKFDGAQKCKLYALKDLVPGQCLASIPLDILVDVFEKVPKDAKVVWGVGSNCPNIRMYIVERDGKHHAQLEAIRDIKEGELLTWERNTSDDSDFLFAQCVYAFAFMLFMGPYVLDFAQSAQGQ